MKSRIVIALLGAAGVLGVSACSAALAAPAADSAVCSNNDITADVTWQPQTATPTGLVALTNTSDRACTLSGRAAVTLTNAADEDVPVPTESVDEPGPSVTFLLPPGSTAFEGIKWTPCDKGDPDCGVGNGLRVTLPGSTSPRNAELSGFPAPEAGDLTMASLRIGTIQASHQDVVAW